MKARTHWIHIIVLAVVFLGAFSYTFDSKLAMLGDNASYYMLGKALAEGEGYVNISSSAKRPSNHYPPGYPVIISTVMLFSDSLVSIKIITGLLGLMGLILFYFLSLKLLENEVMAFGITLLAILNAHILWYSSLIMSEVPFLCFSLMSLFFFTKTDLKQLNLRDKYVWLTLISLISSYYIRSLGVALIGGFVLALLFKKNWKSIALYIGVFAAAIAPWFIRGSNLGGSSYIRQLKMINPYQPALGQADLGDFIDRFLENFSRYITKELPDALFPVFDPAYGQEASGSAWLIGLLLMGIMVFGLLKLKDHQWLITGYLLSTFAILMLWPQVWIGVRFVVSIIPILILLLVNGLFQAVLIMVKKSNKKVVAAVLMSIFLLFQFNAISEIHDQAKEKYSPGWRNYFELAKWIDRNVKGETVVACGKPSLFHLFANKYTLRYKFGNPEELLIHLEERQVDYVVIDQVYGNTLRYLLPAVRQYPERFQQVQHLPNPDTYLLKFKR
ncbi:MAG: phospholipid carrier-dependent glycosyltransferase [Bacteroidota bacterium]